MAICCWKYYAPACGEYFMKKEGCGLLAAWMAVYMGFVCLCTGMHVSTIHRTYCMFCIKATVCLLSTVTKQRSRPSMLLDSRVCQREADRAINTLQANSTHFPPQWLVEQWVLWATETTHTQTSAQQTLDYVNTNSHQLPPVVTNCLL